MIPGGLAGPTTDAAAQARQRNLVRRLSAADLVEQAAVEEARDRLVAGAATEEADRLLELGFALAARLRLPIPTT